MLLNSNMSFPLYLGSSYVHWVPTSTKIDNYVQLLIETTWCVKSTDRVSIWIFKNSSEFLLIETCGTYDTLTDMFVREISANWIIERRRIIELPTRKILQVDQKICWWMFLGFRAHKRRENSLLTSRRGNSISKTISKTISKIISNFFFAEEVADNSADRMRLKKF